MRPTRRELLVHGCGGITLAAASYSLPGFIARTAAAAARKPPGRDGRILVIVQLSGGNDGLNTVVPIRQDAYRTLRPTLAIARNQALALNDDVALAPQLRPLKDMFDEGCLSVVQGVGYPNPNRSHFQAMDIWHSGDPTLARVDTGWLGRAIERDADLHALHVDDEALPLALRGRSADVPSVRTIESFRLNSAQGFDARAAIERVLASPGGEAGTPRPVSDLEYIRRAAVSACANARRLDGVGGGEAAGYPGFALARRLREIATLIAAEFGPRIYYTSLGGFDTHARQNTQHPNLLAELGQSVRAFFADLRDRGLDERVVLMTFSEFGRRAAENGSFGTDHGAAAPLFVAGPGVRAGVVGPPPNLEALVDGDVPHSVDFRSVYADLLDGWLELPSQEILGGRFPTVALIRK